MIILGIDPGLALTGYGIIKEKTGKMEEITYGCIRTRAEDSRAQRLLNIYRDLEEIITKFNPDSVAVEEIFFNKNSRSAFLVGEARGAALLAAAQSNLEAFEYTPLQVKQSVVGYGRATKNQVMEMVKILLNLKKPVKPDDAADALAVAICHLHSHKLKMRGLL
ncbi:MAG: crossover junction endodeoxyribonuclease RuvC [Candidatus Syntrophonatronum acetioxidans]|uniref:Crossover junction endodeoxyribonuclease RuvC n=1 Tax=Candidatus Syntrophonatronum acetioxidans TaxID=1795816 RepID=A0A424YHB4_9FIRM|nr:MAG: crossover junction endodeoxyribonuclease RuvC [Candidatus Syntrophonatronum acetioxidans]